MTARPDKPAGIAPPAPPRPVAALTAGAVRDHFLSAAARHGRTPMKVSELLRKKGTRILTARMDESVETAARLLSKENVGALVVKDSVGTEGDTVVGMFSERDLLHAMVEHGPAALKKPVAALMSRKVVHCGPDDDLAHVLDLMDRHYVRHLPVIHDHQLLGVVSIRDFIALRLEELRG
jgi:CBS domain-containing protein